MICSPVVWRGQPPATADALRADGRHSRRTFRFHRRKRLAVMECVRGRPRWAIPSIDEQALKSTLPLDRSMLSRSTASRRDGEVVISHAGLMSRNDGRSRSTVVGSPVRLLGKVIYLHETRKEGAISIS
jgi:hypothetical protein